MSKLSDIFRRASRGLPSDRYACICLEFDREFRRVEERCIRTKEETLEFDELYEKAEKIINKFKPKYARSGQFWYRVRDTRNMPAAFCLMDIATKAYVFNTVEEAQKARKETLLKCAEIAEKEGL